MRAVAVPKSSIAALFILVVTTAAAAQEDFKETYTAFAVAMGTTNPPVLPPGVTTTVQINVTRWTTDEERAMLFTELVENGQEALVKALQKQKETGWIRVTGRGAGMSSRPSERLRYAREIDMGDSRRIVLALDRPISMWEAVRRPRWEPYSLTLIVLDVDAKGEGVGQLAIAVKLSVDTENKTLVVENFGTEPIRLQNVRRTN
jgi:hypothetical protein